MGVLGYSRPVCTDDKLDPTTVQKPLSFLSQMIVNYAGGNPAEVATIEKQLGGPRSVRYALGHGLRWEVDFIQFLDKDQMVTEIATIPGEIYPELGNV